MYGSEDQCTNSLKSERQSEEKNTISFDLLSCTLLYSEYRLHKIAVWFTVLAKRNKCLLFNSFRIYNLPDSFKFRFLGMDVLQRRVKNVIISTLRWKSGGKLVFCARNPAYILERASALDPGHIIPKEEKPRTEGNEDICIISNSPASIIGQYFTCSFSSWACLFATSFSSFFWVLWDWNNWSSRSYTNTT